MTAEKCAASDDAAHYLHCKVSVWEKKWMNFKQITKEECHRLPLDEGDALLRAKKGCEGEK